MAWATVFGSCSVYAGLLLSYHFDVAAGAMIAFDEAGRVSGFERVGDMAIVVTVLAMVIAWLLARRMARRAPR